MYLGCACLFHGYESNGARVHPATVTRVWSANCVNVTVFPDMGTPKVFERVAVCHIPQKDTGPFYFVTVL